MGIKCICLRDCLLKHESKRAIHYSRDQEAEFDKCPEYFSPIDGALSDTPQEVGNVVDKTESGQTVEKFSFGDAPEVLLMSAEYNLKDLKEFCEREYGISIHANTQKTAAVQQFINARFSSVQIGRDGKVTQ